MLAAQWFDALPTVLVSLTSVACQVQDLLRYAEALSQLVTPRVSYMNDFPCKVTSFRHVCISQYLLIAFAVTCYRLIECCILCWGRGRGVEISRSDC